ncbi:MAG: hypothetical protein JXR87_06105, partial [Candidatus Marinimicrobia bacterium]|nr:hypothetical protein [Candidatus Neomarinimicrobiota bacterium]
GEITFTPYRLITSDSRISVDFQYSNLIYQKNIWIARNTTALANGKLKVTAGMISETDDKDNPIELTLSDSDIAHLKTLGDNIDGAFQSTIIEDSAGIYFYDLTDSILVYTGHSGTHSASFYNVGEKGAYRKVYTSDSYYFEFVDKADPASSLTDIEEAVYLPVKPLKLPTSQRLYHFSGQWQPSKNVSVISELAGSEIDRNIFSNRDDNDNRDLALNISTNIGIPLTGNSKAGVKLNYRNIGKQFEPIDRIQEVEYRRKWDLSSDSTQGEQVMEAGLNLNVKNIVDINLDLGSYNRNTIDANRYKISSSVQFHWIDRLEITQERIQRSLYSRSSDWLRQRFLLRLKIKDVKPFTEIYSEERSGGIGNFSNFQFLEQRYGLEVNGSRRFSGKIESYFRDDKNMQNGNWVQSGSSQNFIVSGQMNDWKTLSSRFSYTYRIKEYFGSEAIPNQEVQLMDVVLKQQPRKLPYSWETTMKIEEERTVKKEFQYYYVGDGEGQYIYDSTYSDYVPHPNGDYILRIVPSEIKEPVTSIRNGLRLQLNGRRLRGKIPWEFPTRLTTLTDIRLQQQIRSSDNPMRILAVDVANIDDRWAYFNRTFQQDILYYFEQRKSNLRFRYMDNNTVSQLDVRGQENSIIRETSLRYKGDFIGGLKLESECASKYTFRESGFNVLRNRDIRAYRFENTFSYLWNIVHLYECELKSSYDLDQGEDAIEAFLLGIRNSYERKVRNKGRWEAFLEIDQVMVTPEGSSIPWEMSGGRKEGNTYGWGISAEYKIGPNLSLRLNYEGWNEPDRDVYHMGGGEIRALF